MQLIDLLGPSRVVAAASVTSKKRLLELLARLLADGAGAERERLLFDSLCTREKLGSTGLGHGVAIPHGRSNAIGSATGAFVQLAEPIDFGASDGRPVDLVFALAVPEHFSNQHLLLLSQLAEMFSDVPFSDRLRAAGSAPALLELLSGWQRTRASA